MCIIISYLYFYTLVILTSSQNFTFQILDTVCDFYFYVLLFDSNQTLYGQEIVLLPNIIWGAKLLTCAEQQNQGSCMQYACSDHHRHFVE